MKLGPSARFLFGVAAIFFFYTGAQEWSAQSSGTSNWADETSFIALGHRAQGKLKVGLGIGFLALAMAGVAGSRKDDSDKNV